MVIARQLDDWRLLPKPQPFTELYFTNYHKLPPSVRPGSKQKIMFIVRNQEHTTTTYHYKLKANSRATLLGSGTFTLTPDQSKVIEKTITLPMFKKRMAVRVELTHTDQKQSIHYWVTPGKVHRGGA